MTFNLSFKLLGKHLAATNTVCENVTANTAGNRRTEKQILFPPCSRTTQPSSPNKSPEEKLERKHKKGQEGSRIKWDLGASVYNNLQAKRQQVPQPRGKVKVSKKRHRRRVRKKLLDNQRWVKQILPGSSSQPHEPSSPSSAASILICIIHSLMKV